MLDFLDCYHNEDWRKYVYKSVLNALHRFPKLPELDVDTCVCEAWSRIWRHWEKVEKAGKPKTIAGYTAMDAVRELAYAVLGSKATRSNGKPVITNHGTRKQIRFSQVNDPEFTIETAPIQKTRGSQQLDPMMKVMVREHVAIFASVNGLGVPCVREVLSGKDLEL